MAQPKFQRDFADQIIPCILTMLQDRANPRYVRRAPQRNIRIQPH